MSKRILVVEDEEENIVVITQLLELVLQQQEVIVARDGHEAMELAYRERPDIILLDLTLPKLDGWEVARSLKSDESFQETPILAVTAHAMVGDRERALQAGCDDYLAKPINVDQFVAFVQRYL